MFASATFVHPNPEGRDKRSFTSYRLDDVDSSRSNTSTAIIGVIDISGDGVDSTRSTPTENQGYNDNIPWYHLQQYQLVFTLS